MSEIKNIRTKRYVRDVERPSSSVSVSYDPEKRTEFLLARAVAQAVAVGRVLSAEYQAELRAEIRASFEVQS